MLVLLGYRSPQTVGQIDEYNVDPDVRKHISPDGGSKYSKVHSRSSLAEEDGYLP